MTASDDARARELEAAKVVLAASAIPPTDDAADSAAGEGLT